MNLRKAFYRVTRPDAVKFAEQFTHLRLDPSLAEFPLNSLFKSKPATIQSFLDSFKILASHKPVVLGKEQTDTGKRTIIKLHPWRQDIRDEMHKAYPDIQWLETSAFQKFYMDHCGNSPKSLLLKGPFGHLFLDYNNVGAIGGDVYQGTRVNLFVGASDIFNSSKNHIGYDNNLTVQDWVLETEVPFSEMATNINGGMEGANYPIIIDKTKKYSHLISGAGGILENLFVFGGWHNLLYGKNTEKDWQAYADELLCLAPRVVFYEIISPILKYDHAIISKYQDQGMGSWGAMEMNEDNYNTLKRKMRDYNEWLKGYCDDHEHALMIPTQTIIEYNEDEMTTFFMDINHFRKNDLVSQTLITKVNEFLGDNATFFTPKLSNVSEYVYPIF